MVPLEKRLWMCEDFTKVPRGHSQITHILQEDVESDKEHTLHTFLELLSYILANKGEGGLKFWETDPTINIEHLRSHSQITHAIQEELSHKILRSRKEWV